MWMADLVKSTQQAAPSSTAERTTETTAEPAKSQNNRKWQVASLHIKSFIGQRENDLRMILHITASNT